MIKPVAPNQRDSENGVASPTGLNPAEINKIQGFFRPKVAQSGPVWYKLDTGVQFDFRAVSLALSSFNLRLESIDVARVEGGFAHVREPQYLASQPFQSDRETAMRSNEWEIGSFLLPSRLRRSWK